MRSPAAHRSRRLTDRAIGIDDASQVSSKTTTTVAMDFGRITVDDTLVMYLFGTPGQDRFGFMWDDIRNGALGAVVLVDTRRIDQSFAAIDHFEQRGVPFVVGVNHFDGSHRYPLDEIREPSRSPPRSPSSPATPCQRHRQDGPRHPPRKPRPPRRPGQRRGCASRPRGRRAVRGSPSASLVPVVLVLVRAGDGDADVVGLRRDSSGQADAEGVEVERATCSSSSFGST